MMKRHILSVLSQNKSGVLAKISGLLRRKLFNIDSLTVGKTCDEKVARFTIVIFGEPRDAEMCAGQIEKLVDVLSVRILPENTLVREIVLARLNLETSADEKFLHAAERGVLSKEIYRKGDELCLELIDTSQNLENFLAKIQKSDIEILEWVRSGVIAMKDRS